VSSVGNKVNEKLVLDIFIWTNN